MTLDEFESVEDKDWSALEAELIRCAPLGEWAELPSKADCPQDTSDSSRRVRAGLIRFLLLGGGEGRKTHAKGVRLRGAWVDGELDFEAEKTRLDCFLWQCLFPSRVTFRDAELRGLYLTGSDLRQGLDAQRLTTETDVHLRNGFTAQGLVDLAGARIGGQLDCSGGRFRNARGKALNCNAAVIGADVFLGGGFSAEGEVCLIGAQIGGQLACAGGSFRSFGGPALDCEAAVIGADVFFLPERDKHGKTVDCRLDGALDFTRVTVKGRLQLYLARLNGPVSLNQADIGILADDTASWAGVTRLQLSGLTYDRINSEMTVGQRLEWLARKVERPMPFAHPAGADILPWADLGRSFDPQPYTQVARVLAASGNRTGAARVRCAREGLISQAEYRRSLARLDGSFGAGVVSLGGALRRRWDILFGWTFGHGHRPARVFWWIGGIILLATLLYGHVFDLGQMAPNSAVILTSADWQAALAQGGAPLPHWLETRTAREYETFSAFLYAVDLFLPLDAIGQESAWAPSHDRGWWGALGYWMRAPIQFSGWLIAAMAAAVVTGLVGRSDDSR